MSQAILRPFIVKVSVLGYFPLYYCKMSIYIFKLENTLSLCKNEFNYGIMNYISYIY